MQWHNRMSEYVNQLGCNECDPNCLLMSAIESVAKNPIPISICKQQHKSERNAGLRKFRGSKQLVSAFQQVLPSNELSEEGAIRGTEVKTLVLDIVLPTCYLSWSKVPSANYRRTDNTRQLLKTVQGDEKCYIPEKTGDKFDFLMEFTRLWEGCSAKAYRTTSAERQLNDLQLCNHWVEHSLQ